MKFGEIDHLLLLGGSRGTAELAQYLKVNHKNLAFEIITAPRQIDDVIYPDGRTLKNALDAIEQGYVVTDDINTCQEFLKTITPNTLGLGMGETWAFSSAVIERFNGKLLDLMGIRLPQYRGGAHYTWQILTGNRIGACNLQVINEEMIQGVYDSGEIVYFKEYHFSPSVRIPHDYFNEAVDHEINFLIEFIELVNQGYEFNPFYLQENFSRYFPRLNSIKNAFLDWQWDSIDIDRFICAFDDPYPGCTTFLNGNKIRIKKSTFESNDGPFHAFQCGLVYKVYNDVIYVCSKSGTIQLKEVFDETGANITSMIKNGDKFQTPFQLLQEAHAMKIE